MRTRKTFSAKEKSKVVEFALHYNRKHGQGGQSAAAGKFGVSPAAVSYWMSAYKITKGYDGWMEAVGLARNGRTRKLAELELLGAEISELRRKLTAAEARFDRLKRSI